MKVGFIGLGNMGMPMARNVLKAGHELKVYNRTVSRAETLRAEGAQVAASPAEAATGVEAVITMLSDDRALEDVVFAGNLLGALPQGAIHLSMSTVGAPTSRKLAETHAKHHQVYVAAPVFGRPDAAAAAKLFIVAAGPNEAVRKCEPLLSAIGQNTFVAGEDPVRANVVKLSGNFLLACVIESLGEAVALVRKYGVDPEQYVQFLTSSLFSAPAYKVYGDVIAKEKYRPAAFRVELGLKDVRLAKNAAESAAVPMPLADFLSEKLQGAITHGFGDWDWSVMAHITAQQAGLNDKK